MRPLQAQFTTLIAPGDGENVYFANALPLKGSGEPRYQGRIFKIGATPLTTIADVSKTGEIYCGTLEYCTSSAYDLSEPDVSRDEKIVIHTGYYGCSGTRCPYPYGTYGLPRQYYGKGRLSGNGRYLVTYSENRGELAFSSLAVTDLESGITSNLPDSTTLGGRFTPDGRVVADEGSFVIVYGQVEVYRHGQFVTTGVPAPRVVANAVINAAGDTVVYQACCSPSELRLFRPDTGQDTVLMHGNGYYKDPFLTADGQKVGFLSMATPGAIGPLGLFQVYIMNLDGYGLQALTSDPDGISQFTLSDDGQNAWYVSNSDALYEVNVVSRQVQQRIPPSSPAYEYYSPSPGSAIEISGAGFGSNLVVTLNGVRAPITGRTSDGETIWTQIPWETPPGSSVVVSIDNGSPFELLGAELKVLAYAPGLAAGPFHADWSGLVSLASPAHPGEIIHFYLTGLGPVNPPVRTGTPGPSNPPALVTTPFQCNAPVLFAGLAPGLIGLYQLDVQIPFAASSNFELSCNNALGYALALP
jgi:uncharacterized protein (TIGR03437 family)